MIGTKKTPCNSEYGQFQASPFSMAIDVGTRTMFVYLVAFARRSKLLDSCRFGYVLGVITRWHLAAVPLR